MKIIILLIFLTFQNSAFAIATRTYEPHPTFINYSYDLEIKRIINTENEILKMADIEKNILEKSLKSLKKSFNYKEIHNPTDIIAEYKRSLEYLETLVYCPEKSETDLEEWQDEWQTHGSISTSVGTFLGNHTVKQLQKNGVKRKKIIEIMNCHQKMQFLHLKENINKKLGYIKFFIDDFSYMKNYKDKEQKIVNLFNKNGEISPSSLVSGILRRDIKKIFFNNKLKETKLTESHLLDISKVYIDFRNDSDSNEYDYYNISFQLRGDIHHLNLVINYPTGKLISMRIQRNDLETDIRNMYKNLNGQRPALHSVYDEQYSNEENLKRCKELSEKVKNKTSSFSEIKLLKELENCAEKLKFYLRRLNDN